MQRFVSQTRSFTGSGLWVSKTSDFLSAVGVMLALASTPSNADVYTRSVMDPAFGATGNGSTDDRLAIQNTIDTVHTYIVAHPGSTGVVYFPPGTYRVTVNEDPPWRWQDSTHDQPVACLFMYKNITLQGAGQTLSVIKVADYPQLRVPKYLAIILFPDIAMRDAGQPYWYYSGDSTNFNMLDLALDGNSASNRIDLVSTGGDYKVNDDISRSGLIVSWGTGIFVRRSRFQNFATGATATFGGDSPLNATMSDTTFTGMGGGNTFVNGGYLLADYDVSSLYVTTRVSTDTFVITNSTFEKRTDNVFYGVRTAMELHGPNITVRNNTVQGYSNAVNVVGHPVVSDSQVYDGNTFNNVGVGFSVWSFVTMGLTNTQISNNNININVDLWTSAETLTPPTYSGREGIAFAYVPNLTTGPIANLTIINNRITFSSQSPTLVGDPGIWGRVRGERGAGIAIGDTDDEVYPNKWANIRVTNLVIQNNTILNALSNGILLNSDVRGARISGNSIVDPGSCPFNAYGTTVDEQGGQMPAMFTAALRVRGVDLPCSTCPPAAQNVSVPGFGNPSNNFQRTAGRTTMGFGIYTDRTPGYWVTGANDFLTTQVTGIPYYQDPPRMGVINCDYDTVAQQYIPPCYGWTLRP